MRVSMISPLLSVSCVLIASSRDDSRLRERDLPRGRRRGDLFPALLIQALFDDCWSLLVRHKQSASPVRVLQERGRFGL